MLRAIPNPESYPPNAGDSNRGDNQRGGSYFDSEQSKKTARRLLGLDRVYDLIEDEQMRSRYLVTSERKRAFDGIDTNTLPRKSRIEQKRGIVSELLKGEMISADILRNYPTVYLGCGADAEYPLSIGSRNLEMVDPVLSRSEIQKEILEKVRNLIYREVILEDNGINFDFDFGFGLEKVSIILKPQFFNPPNKEIAAQYGEYQPPDKIGLLICFALQGPLGRVEINEQIKSKVVDGGAILIDSSLTKIISGLEKKIDLGKRE